VNVVGDGMVVQFANRLLQTCLL